MAFSICSLRYMGVVWINDVCKIALSAKSILCPVSLHLKTMPARSNPLRSQIWTCQVEPVTTVDVHNAPGRFRNLDTPRSIRVRKRYDGFAGFVECLEQEDVDAMSQGWADGLVEVGLRVDVVGYRVAVDGATVNWPAGLTDHEVDLVGTTGDCLDVVERPEGLVEEVRRRVFEALV